MEKRITFTSGNLILEGLFDQVSTTRCAIITHPHPLYGGEMSNPVVNAIRTAYRDNGYSTLRFNFRGTGRSDGTFDNGTGEQQDVLSARDYLSGRGFESIDLAGYSFGSWVNLMTENNHGGFQRLVMVSPPVDFIEFEPVDTISPLFLVVTGSHDTFARPQSVKPLVTQWNTDAAYKEIAGADHFYSNELEVLNATLKQEIPPA